MRLVVGLVVLAVIASVVMEFLSWVPRHPFPANGALQASFHVVMPAAISAPLAAALLRWNKFPPLWCFIFAFSAALLVGFTSEAPQLDSPTRVASVSDLLLDVGGAAIGLVIGGMLHQRLWQPGRDK